jgi:hypothetical protein
MLPQWEIAPDRSHIYFLVFGLGNATIRTDTDSGGLFLASAHAAARDIGLMLPESSYLMLLASALLSWWRMHALWISRFRSHHGFQRNSGTDLEISPDPAAEATQRVFQ